MKLRQFRKDGINEVGCMVVDDNDVPIDHICRYTLIELSGANSTQANITRHVIHIERWAQNHGVDLEDEVVLGGLARGEFFTSFIRHLERYSDQTGVVVTIETVEPEYFNQRIEAAVDYFDYLVHRAIARRRIGDPNILHITKLAEKLKARLQKLKRPVTKSSQVHGLSLLLQSSLYQGLRDPKYFGWNRNTALRNKLICRIFYETGIRRGELLSLTIENCRTGKLNPGERPYIHTQENVRYDDPRTDVPHNKTRNRIIPISNSLADLIEEYKKIRNKPEAARKQPPFLILSGQHPYPPLSTSALSSVFGTMRDRLPGLDQFGPHRLRHTFFENLDRMMHQKNYSDAEKKKIKNSIGGWSPKSRQSENYEKLATLEQATEALSLFQSELEGI
ncbi:MULTISPECIES: site-specific integrase [Rheinheimera]|uniref:site-specific integrase n=1 Tax=Rheinheimera TaxID=67575 RepID=UPI0026935EC8